MKCNQAGIDLIRRFESCRLDAYPDPATGGEPWTIGFGSTEGVCKGMRITFENAVARLLAHLAPLEVQIAHLVHQPISENAFSALTCLAYNIGIGNLEHSTLLKLINAGEFKNAADQFLVWNKAQGKVLNGLTKRREAERTLFLS